jgi:four helix bundle protein
MREYEFSFEKLIAWQKAKDIVLLIYEVTADFPNNEKYSLISQMRRSAISIPSNLAEGSSRKSKKDKLRYLQLSYSSLMELYNHCLIAADLHYLSQIDLERVRSLVHEVANIMNGLRKSYSSKESV